MEVCNFCGKEKKETDALIAGVNGYICNLCAERVSELINQTPEEQEVEKK